MDNDSGTFIVRIGYDRNATPQWTVDPESLRVPPGNQPVIWQLNQDSIQRGVKFDDTKGIVIPPKNVAPKNNLHDWPGTTPARQNDHMYTSTDRNSLGTGDPAQVFRYDINVIDSTGPASMDPDVTNTPPGGGGGADKDKDKDKDKEADRDK